MVRSIRNFIIVALVLLCVPVYAGTLITQHYAQYGTQATFYFTLEDISDAEAPFTGTAPLAADIWISKDGGTVTNATNASVAIGNGIYAWTATASEMQAGRLLVSIYDATASAIFKPGYLQIETGISISQLTVDASNGPTNAVAITATGNGTGQGIKATGGSTGHGIYGASGASSTESYGIVGTSLAADGHGIVGVGTGTGSGLYAQGGATAPGLLGIGGATSGSGAEFTTQAGNSVGLLAVGKGTGAGIGATGGLTGHGISGTSGASSTDKYGIAGLSGATNGHGIVGVGTGTGSGIYGQGGLTGNGLLGVGGATSGIGILATAQAGNSNGFQAQGFGSGHGFFANGGASGDGMRGYGGSTSGYGIYGLAQGTGHGIAGTGINTGSGIVGVGGSTGQGLYGVGGSSSGNGIMGQDQSGAGYGFYGFPVARSSNFLLEPIADISGAPAFGSTNVKQSIGYLLARFYNKVTQTSAVQTIYASDSATTATTCATSDDGTTQTKSKCQ